jgi:hypothetical protein
VVADLAPDFEYIASGAIPGVEVRWDVWNLWTMRDGKVVRGQGFTSRAEALEAGGLSTEH